MRILVVDDDRDFRENMLDILEAEGYGADAAGDGFDAVEQVVRMPRYDVIFMDIRMPVMDGVEAFRRIKHISPESKVMVITAYADDPLVQDALREGAHAVFGKPLKLEELLAALREIGLDQPVQSE
jgi:CheY-like chemotaxis protein